MFLVLRAMMIEVDCVVTFCVPAGVLVAPLSRRRQMLCGCTARAKIESDTEIYVGIRPQAKGLPRRAIGHGTSRECCCGCDKEKTADDERCVHLGGQGRG